jgi:membrane-associated protease RseP (regulator of RpoE activity)
MNSKHLILILIFILFWTALIPDEQAHAVVQISGVPHGKVIFQARDATLAEIVEEFRIKYSIEIKGLEERKTEKISFSFDADTLEALLKGLLRHLGIKNYAFEFADDDLKRLVVVPEATSDVSSLPISPEDLEQKKEAVNVAQIQGIVESSQAESADLQAGDLIIEYDGVPITSAQQLISEVEKKAAKSQIEMVVVRQKIRMRLIINGGFIGVRITTKKISRAEFNTFHW